MKKILSGLLLALMLLFVSCSNSDNTNEVTKVTKYLGDLNSYSLTSTMSINRADKKVSMDVCVDYLAPSYYKVSFKNKDNEQLIIKNNDGVYVLTPSLNKQFKFDSDWPLNSSHAYLLEAICKDIKADSNAVGTTESGVINIECGITHKTNQNLSKMRYTCEEKNLTPKRTVFMNENKEEIITVDFNTFNPNSNLNKDHFNEKQYLANVEEGPTGSEPANVAVTVGYVIEGNTLNTSTTTDNTTILVYSGEKPYTIIVQEANAYAEVVVFDNYDNFEVLTSGLCFINDNSMKYFLDNYEVTIYSNSLSIEEYLNIASTISLV